MPYTFVVGLVIFALLGGCSHLRPAPSVPATTDRSTPDYSLPAAGPRAPSPSAESRPDGEAKPAAVQPSPAASPSGPEPVPAARSTVDRAAAVANVAPVAPSPARTTPAKSVAKPPATPPPNTTPDSAASGKPQAPPSLDLVALEQRLRDTHAVGLFTKLSLKNQVDDLLAQVRSYYRGNKPPPPAELRPRFDGLLLKVLSVVQDGDASLATQIWSSREAIWGVLADPAKFERI
jgi:hypothetical protein